ncbi:MAG: anti-sigma factor antagonist, partial [Planctomycetota bacterium]|nr:anti-sigma factor antagonist [Planctomycetota bacterium]
MATIDFRIKNIRSADGTSATMAELDGSIDASTINQFQAVMDKLVEKGVRNLILDLANVKYINSTGLGVLLKYSDTFEGVEGHLVFCRVPSKVMLVMEMLGFNALFQIFADEAMALKFLGGKMVPPAAVPVKPESAPAPVTAPAPVAAAAPAPAAAPPPVPVPAPAAPPAPIPAPAAPAPAAAPPAPATFPMHAPCARCRVLLEIPACGKYRCPRCGAILAVEPSGRVRFFASKRGCPLEMSIPSDPALAPSIGEMAGAVARSLGVNGATASAISDAVREACLNVI